ncbi:hypothetical protein ACFQL1_18400 [Halomicroarcula sp. GCM10025709]|uniref:hypothetical protein n=1 Tax=Halomicroarcula sp. GCM10025709 TaxID=3252669 RepID=UPI00360902AF
MKRWSFGPQPTAALVGAVVGVCGALFLLEPRLVASPDGGPSVPGLPSGSISAGEVPLAAVYVGAVLGTVLAGFLFLVVVTKGIALFLPAAARSWGSTGRSSRTRRWSRWRPGSCC